MLIAKKSLGQHFLTDDNIARKIVGSLVDNSKFKIMGRSQSPECSEGEAKPQNLEVKLDILEIGPGMGVLTRHLISNNHNLYIIEKDRDAAQYLIKHFPEIKDKIIIRDFLEYDLNEIFPHEFAVIGNFPYNISTQILFKVLDFRNRVPLIVGMFQKEVAERIASKPHSKVYGILSVLMQAYYNIEYLFTVNENVFNPPPKVKSGVIRLTRNNNKFLDCDEELFFEVVKTAFNQRRKMIRNALAKFKINSPDSKIIELMTKRAENLNVSDFVNITNEITKALNDK